MGTKNMTKTGNDTLDNGGWFQTILVQASGLVSDNYLLPYQPMYALGAQIVGSGTLAFSIDPPATVTAGSGYFVDWDGVASINLAVTAFHYTTTTASGTAKVIAKTHGTP